MKVKNILQLIGLFIAIVGFIWMLGFPKMITEYKSIYEFNEEFYLKPNSPLYKEIGVLEINRLDFWNQTAFLLEAIGFVIVLLGQLCEDIELTL